MKEENKLRKNKKEFYKKYDFKRVFNGDYLKGLSLLRDDIWSWFSSKLKEEYKRGKKEERVKPMWTGLEKMAYQKGYRAGLKVFVRRAEKNFDWHNDSTSLPPKYERTNWIRSYSKYNNRIEKEYNNRIKTCVYKET